VEVLELFTGERDEWFDDLTAGRDNLATSDIPHRARLALAERVVDQERVEVRGRRRRATRLGVVDSRSSMVSCPSGRSESNGMLPPLPMPPESPDEHFDLIVIGSGPAGEKAGRAGCVLRQEGRGDRARAGAGRRGRAHRHAAEQDAWRETALYLSGTRRASSTELQ